MGHDDYNLVVCLNGHPATAAGGQGSEMMLCPHCGERTIGQCPACASHIRGNRSQTNVNRWEPNGYCHSCGMPYPWTKQREEAISEMIDELEGLGIRCREELKRLIPIILGETAESERAARELKSAIIQFGGIGRFGLVG